MKPPAIDANPLEMSVITNPNLSQKFYIKQVATSLVSAIQSGANIDAVFSPPRREENGGITLPTALQFDLKIEGFEDIGVHSLWLGLNVELMYCTHHDDDGLFTWDGYVASVSAYKVTFLDFEGRPLTIDENSGQFLKTINAFTDEEGNQAVLEALADIISMKDRMSLFRDTLHNYNTFYSKEADTTTVVLVRNTANNIN